MTNNQSAIPVTIYGGAGAGAATNLAMDAFTVDNTSNFSVTYNCPFSQNLGR